MSCWVMCMKPCSPMLVHAVAVNAPDLLPANPASQERLRFCTGALTQAVMTCLHSIGTSTDLQAAQHKLYTFGGQAKAICTKSIVVLHLRKKASGDGRQQRAVAERHALAS